LTLPNSAIELSVTSQAVFEALQSGGALFFSELVTRSGLLPSQVEEALSQLAALGLVTQTVSTGYARFLFLQINVRPLAEIRKTPAQNKPCQHRVCGSLVIVAKEQAALQQQGASSSGAGPREAAIEKFARVLLRRYGLFFAIARTREFARLRGTSSGAFIDDGKHAERIRGGYFVGGVSGEQFALAGRRSVYCGRSEELVKRRADHVECGRSLEICKAFSRREQRIPAFTAEPHSVSRWTAYCCARVTARFERCPTSKSLS
jgi:ATP-dependent Lhr-like helicase